MKKSLSIFLVTVALIAGMVGCAPTLTPGYNLTMVANPTVGGTATDLTNTSPYTAGTVVSIQAQAAAGYQFANWTGPVGTFANPNAATTTFTMPPQAVTVTANFRQQPGPLDHFRCYWTEGAEFIGEDVYLEDQFGAVEAMVEGAWFFCSPIEKWHDEVPTPISNPDHCLTFYSLYYEEEPQTWFVEVDNQFGTQQLTVRGPVGLGVPTQNVEPGHHEPPVGLDHFLFYEVIEGPYVDVVVDLKDQFTFDDDASGDEYDVLVTAPVYFANPVRKTHGGIVTEIENPEAHLVFYDRSGLGSYHPQVQVVNQFGEQTFGVYYPAPLAVPSEKLFGAALGIKEIRTWHDLDAVRDNLSHRYILMNDLDVTTAGYAELASPTANQGKGWQPIGTWGHPFKGSFDGQRYEISDLFIDRLGEGHLGLFGYVDERGIINDIGVVNAEVTGNDYVGGLVGFSAGNVTNSYSTGSVTGNDYVGGLVGFSAGNVTNSYSTGSVAGESDVGGLMGENEGTVSNSYYSYDQVLINGKNIITIGALSNEDFDQWLAKDKFLDVNERLSQEDGYYLINDVSDFKQLLAFGQDDSLKFRLKNDLDLGNEPNFYIPYVAGEFDGNGHKILNLSFDFDFVSHVGLFGYLASGGKVSEVGVENVNVTGDTGIGGLVGFSAGNVTNSYSTGSVTGNDYVGGLVGVNWGGTVSNSYSTGNVAGESDVGGLMGVNWGGTVSNSYSTGSVTGNDYVGGLVGFSFHGSVSNSYSTGSVTGGSRVGGLVGANYEGTVSNSFWDVETSGQVASAGGTSKTTAEMQDIATFSGAGWNIIAVSPGERNTICTWNIVDGETYPFLSWESVG